MIEESRDFSVLRNQDSRGRQEVDLVAGGITWNTLNGFLSGAAGTVAGLSAAPVYSPRMSQFPFWNTS